VPYCPVAGDAMNKIGVFDEVQADTDHHQSTCAYASNSRQRHTTAQDRPLLITISFWATVCKTVRPTCLSCLSLTLIYCGQTVRWIKMPLGTEVSLSPGHIVLDGDPAPLTGAQQPLPNVSPHFYCGQTVAHLSNYRALISKSSVANKSFPLKVKQQCK